MGNLGDRIGEQYLISSPGTKAENLTKSNADVATPSAAYLEMEEHREICRDLWGGTLRMRERGEKYLPRWDGEDKTTEWKARKDAAVLTNFFRRAVEGMVDKAFVKDLQLEAEGLTNEEEGRVRAFMDNVDQQGSTLTQFARGLAERSLALNNVSVLVDFPQRDAPAESAADEEGLLPCLKEVSPGSLIEAKGMTANGVLRLGRARYTSTRRVEDGEWGEGVVNQVNVLRRGEGGPAFLEVYEEQARGKWAINEELGGPFVPPENVSAAIRSRFVEIPLVPVYTGSHGFFHSLPIMRELAEMNALHFSKKSNFDRAVGVSSVPMNAFIGFTQEEMAAQEWGPYRYVLSGNDQAKVQDISFQYSSAQIGIEDLEKLERYMAMAALEPSTSRATGEEKSTIRLIDEAKTMSRLQAWALGWMQGFQDILDWAQAWMGIEPGRAKLRYLDEVFESLQADPNFDALLNLRLSGVPIPPDVMLTEAQRYGVLSDSWDVSDLIERGSTEAV